MACVKRKLIMQNRVACRVRHEIGMYTVYVSDKHGEDVEKEYLVGVFNTDQLACGYAARFYKTDGLRNQILLLYAKEQPIILALDLIAKTFKDHKHDDIMFCLHHFWFFRTGLSFGLTEEGLAAYKRYS